MFSAGDGFIRVTLRGGAADDFDHARHSYVSVTYFGAAAAADAGYGQFALDEVVVQLPEEAPVAAVVHGGAGVVAAGHAREAAEGAGVPDFQALDFVRAYLAVGDGEAGAGRADEGAAAAFDAAVADLGPGLVGYPAGGYVAHGAGEPG